MRRPLGLLAAAALVAACLSGCVRVPDSGPVVPAGTGADTGERPAGQADAVPPAAGASRQAVVTGFLDAMTAWPVQTNVVKQYLSTDAAAAWNPEAGTIVYADSAPPQDQGGEVTEQLTAADRLDASGSWRGALGHDELDLHFHLTVEDGEFRILDPPDALVVPASWFQQRYRQVSVYYFDMSARILVPEPVFVPVGQQLTTSLVNALLNGHPPRLDGVVQTFVPSGLDEGLSVPVSDDGLADVALTGDAPRLSPTAANLMLAQLAWTLRQDPEVTAVRATIGGTEVTGPGGATQYAVVDAADFAPAGPVPTRELFGIQQRRVVSGTPDDIVPVTGPFGAPRWDPAELAAAPQGDLAAVVTQDHSEVLVAPAHEGSGPDKVRTVVEGAVDLGRPSWDYSGRLWLLDRAGGAARVLVGEPGTSGGLRVHEVRVPGITGTAARRLLASRDGTRLVAVVHRNGRDRLVTSRVVVGASTGRVEGAKLTTVINGVSGGQTITDIAWTSPSTIAVLSPTSRGELYEVDTVVADGASVGEDAVSTIVSGNVLGLAGSPDEDDPTYAVLDGNLVDLATRETIGLPGARISDLDYAG